MWEQLMAIFWLHSDTASYIMIKNPVLLNQMDCCELIKKKIDTSFDFLLFLWTSQK